MRRRCYGGSSLYTGGGGGGGGGGGTIYATLTLAQLQALTPEVDDLGYPTDGDTPYVLVCRVAGTWSYRIPGVAWDVTPPPSTGWSWYNQGTSSIATVGGMQVLTIPAAGASANQSGRTRAEPADPTLTPYVVTFGIEIQFFGIAGGTAPLAAGFTDGTGTAFIQPSSAEITVGRFSSVGVYAGTDATASVRPLGTMYALQIEQNATKRIYRWVNLLDGSTMPVGDPTGYDRTTTFTANAVGFWTAPVDVDVEVKLRLWHYATALV